MAIGLAVVLLAPGSASADLTFDLNSANSVISPFPGPYVQVDVGDPFNGGTESTITFTHLTNGSNDYLMFDSGSAGVNVNATSFTVSGISGTGPQNTPVLSFAGSKNLDGFGSFNLTIDDGDGFKNRAFTITFTVTNTSGTWGTASDVLTPNSKTGALAASHVGVSVSGGAFGSNTGYVGGNGGSIITPQSVPEPSTLAVAGLGTLAFIAYGVRKRLKI
jgi:hypothetical protein